MDREEHRYAELPEWVAERTLPADTAAELREAVVRDLMEVTESHHGAYLSVAMLDGGLCFHDVEVYGDAKHLGLLRACSGRPVTEFVDADTFPPQLNELGAQTEENIGGSRMYETLWTPMGCVAALTMCAVVEGTMVGWIAAYRMKGEEAFAPGLATQLRDRVDAYRHCLDVAHRLDASVSHPRGLLFLDAGGEVVLTCEAGRRWLACRELVRRLGAEIVSPAPNACIAAHGAIARLTPMRGSFGDLFCAEIVPVEPWRVPAVVELSPQQRRVAELAAHGATAKEVGQMLDISAWTVRAHLKQVYSRLGVKSRIELAEQLESFAEAMG